MVLTIISAYIVFAIALMLNIGKAFAGIVGFGAVPDAAMSMQQSNFNLISYFAEISDNIPKYDNDEHFDVIWAHAKRTLRAYLENSKRLNQLHDVADEQLAYHNLKNLKICFQVLEKSCEERNIREKNPRLYNVFQGNYGEILNVIDELMDNSMVGSEVEMYSVPLERI